MDPELYAEAKKHVLAAVDRFRETITFDPGAVDAAVVAMYRDLETGPRPLDLDARAVMHLIENSFGK